MIKLKPLLYAILLMVSITFTKNMMAQYITPVPSTYSTIATGNQTLTAQTTTSTETWFKWVADTGVVHANIKVTTQGTAYQTVYAEMYVVARDTAFLSYKDSLNADSTINLYAGIVADNANIFIRVLNANGTCGVCTYTNPVITITIQNVNINCSPVSTCDLVKNGGFESKNSGASFQCGFGTVNNLIDCWTDYEFTSDVYSDGCTSPTGFDLGTNTTSTITINENTSNPNSHYTAMAFFSVSHWNEATQSLLRNQLVPGHTYSLSIWAYNFRGVVEWPTTLTSNTINTINAGNFSPYFTIASSPTTAYSVFTGSASTLFPASRNILTTIQLTGAVNTWNQYTSTFVATSSDQNIIIGAHYQNNATASYYLNDNNFYIFVDEISIKDISSLSLTGNNACAGSSATLTASGANTYTWQPGNIQASSITSNVNGATYTVTGSYAADPTCTIGPISTTVNIIPQQTMNVTASPSNTICGAGSVTLTASGTFLNPQFLWTPYANYYVSNTIVVSPTVTTTYTVQGSGNSGSGTCPVTRTITVYVAPAGNPTLNVTASPTLICSGNSSVLSASGASSYSWNPGSLTGASVTVSPTITTTYTLTGATPCGQSTKTITVVVNPKPTVTVNSVTICIGSTATLTANGANTYSWSTSATTSSITVSPTITTNYTVTGTSAAGCTNTAVAIVAVTTNTIPAFSVFTNPPSPIIANGTGTNVIGLTTTGITNTVGLTYAWSNGASTPTTNFNLTQPEIISLTISNPYCGSSTQSICVNYVASACSNTTIPVLNNAIITSSTQISASIYKVTGTLTFSLSGAIDVSNKTFRMTTNSKIIVSPRATLLSHTGLRIYSCDGMWNGIELQADASNAAAVNILDDAIIEDAYVAISAGTTTLSTMHSININGTNTQFNKNYTDIKIVNTNSISSAYTFTFSGKGLYSKSSTNSPGGNLKCSSFYTPIVKARSYIGLQAKDAGIITFTVPNGGGTANTEIQNKDYGMTFNNTDANINNVNFNNAVGLAYSYTLNFAAAPAGVGIYSKNSKFLNVKPATTPTVGATTTFSNMGYSIITNNTYTVDVQNTNHTSSMQSYTVDPAWGSGANAYIWGGAVGDAGYGLNGIFATNARDVLRINNNTFTNNYYPITANYTLAPTTNAIMSVAQNTIMETGSAEVREGATINSAVNFTPTTNNMRVAANTFSNVTIGVKVTSTTIGLRISNNTFTLNPAMASKGIYIAGSNTVTADNNTIYGSLTSTNVANFSVNNHGILCESSQGCKIQCNTISNVGMGIEYRGINTSSGDGFFNNTLNYPIRRGLFITNGGIIGTQGSSTGASANQWLGSWPSPATTDPNKTSVGGTLIGGTASDAANSPLWVKNNTNELPNDNYITSPSIVANAYISPISIFTTTASNYATCPTTLTALKVAQNGNNSSVERDADFVNYVTNVLSSSNTAMSPQDKFMLKQFMFDDLTQNPSVNSTLVNFVNQQQNTSVDVYHEIDSLLANGYINAATAKNAQASQSNDITQTQNAYNALYINGISNQSDLDNLTSIADLCPQLYGNAVYQARALLQSITYVGKVYADSCDNSKVRKSVWLDDEPTSVSVADGVQAKLYPNPNNGSFTLAYDLKALNTANVTIYDISGKLVYRKAIDNLETRININTMNLNNGIYFIQLSDDTKLLWTDKLVIQK